MESQMTRPHDKDPQTVGLHSEVEGEDEHHHEKKSMLTKVKDRAKKIKGSFTKHGHGDERDDHDQNEKDDDEDEEMVEDPEVLAAPKSESTDVKMAVPGQELEQSRVNVEKPTSIKEDRYSGKITESPTKSFGANGDLVPEDRTHGQPRVKMGRETELEEDPHSPKDPRGGVSDHHQTKVVDPAGRGGEEQGMAPILRSFDKMNVHDEPEPKTKSGSEHSQYTESHDQFSPKNTQSVPQSFDSGKPEEVPRDTIARKPSGSGPEQSQYTGSHDQLSPENTQSVTQSFDSGKAEEMPRDTIAGKPSGSGPEQSQYTGSHDQLSPENNQSVPQSFDSEKLEEVPHDTVAGKPSNQSYTEKITFATSAIAGKAILAKNVVATKLGYGGKEGTQEKHEEGQGDTSKTSPVAEYGYKIATTVTGKLAPVYEKVAGAGSIVMSKVQGTGVEQEKKESGPSKGSDKGVSVKEYLAKKFRPSEEDRALSDVISDAIHKRNESSSEKEEESRPMGKVTESEEVKRQLGTESKESGSTGDQGAEAVVSGEKGVVGKLKGAVGSWFGKTNESQSSQTSLGASHETKQEDGVRGQEAVGERRLQESTN